MPPVRRVLAFTDSNVVRVPPPRAAKSAGALAKGGVHADASLASVKPEDPSPPPVFTSTRTKKKPAAAAAMVKREVSSRTRAPRVARSIETTPALLPSSTLTPAQAALLRGVVGDPGKWLSLCRPNFDLADEKSPRLEDVLGLDDEDSEDDEEDGDYGGGEDGDEDEDMDDGDYECDGGKSCCCGKPVDATQGSGSVWAVSEMGWKLAQRWAEEARVRCPDEFDVVIEGGWEAEGIAEVLENALLLFDANMRQQIPDVLRAWSVVESVALFLTMDVDIVDVWMGNDDLSQNTDLITLIGCALLNTLHHLSSLGLFTTVFHLTSPCTPRNIPLILAMYIRLGVTCSPVDLGPCFNWASETISFAAHAGVPIAGLTSTPADMQQMAEPMEDVDEELARGLRRLRVDWVRPDWRAGMEAYLFSYGEKLVGGRRFDISAMSDAQRKGLEGEGEGWEDEREMFPNFGRARVVYKFRCF